jgi:hypothetical protein
MASSGGRLGGDMSWILAFIIIAVAVAMLVGGTVLHPGLYGMLIAAVLVIPLWMGSSAIDGIINLIFGRRR